MSASRPLPGDRRFHACYGEVTVARSTSTLMCIVEDAAGREHLALYESLKPLANGRGGLLSATAAPADGNPNDSHCGKR